MKTTAAPVRSSGPAPPRFWPPRFSRAVLRCVWPISSRALWRFARVSEVELLPPARDLFDRLRGQRVLMTPSHSGGLEVFVMFHLSRMLRREWFYMAGHEAFLPPLQGWLLQRVGCYSIVRATADRESFRTTRQILAAGERPLVIFPEGESMFQNDVVLPFQEGVAQLAFWALDDLVKQGDPPPLYFLPMAIKYIYLADMRDEIDRALARLERKVGVAKAPGASLYTRLRAVGETVLAVGEADYGVRPEPGATLDDRLQRIKHIIVERAALALGVPDNSERPLVDRIRSLFNEIERWSYEEIEESEYLRERRQQRQEKARVLYDDLMRVLQMAALHEGYVGETQSAERFLEVIGRLELEVYRRRWVRGPRKAIVQVGEPINVTERYADYRRDRRSAVHALTQTTETAVLNMLLGLGRFTRPLQS